GSLKTVTVPATGAGAFSLTGTDAGNYSLAAGPWTTTAAVTAKSLTGSFTAQDKVYDGNTSATIATRSLSGVVGSDNVSLSGGSACSTPSPSGSLKTVTVPATGADAFSLTGTDAGNYSLAAGPWTTTAAVTAKS